MFYATFDSRMTDYIQCHGEVETGGIDLWRFKTKKERDEFVADSDYAESILAKKAKEEHKEQFRYWEN